MSLRAAISGLNAAVRRCARRVLPALAALSAALAALSLGLPAPALAADNTSQMTGTATVAVVTPIAMTNLSDMRFGSIAQPNAAGTLTLSPSSTITSTGGVADNYAIAQGSTGPAAGTFQITGGAGRAFTVFGPISFQIRNGAASMSVTLLTGSLQLQSSNGVTSSYLLNVGGTLSIGANQAVGGYTGTYQLLTAYQ